MSNEIKELQRQLNPEQYYRDLCAEKEAEIGELRDQLQLWKDNFCKLVKARDRVVLRCGQAELEAEKWRDLAQDAANGYTNWAKNMTDEDWKCSWEKK